MNKTVLAIIIVTLGLLVGGVFLLTRPAKPIAPPTGIEYFWGNGCPHCKIVDEFIQGWDKKDKIQWTKYEVWYDKGNLKIYEDRAKRCELKQNEMGVPLMLTEEGKCLSGDQPIIDYLKSVFK